MPLRRCARKKTLKVEYGCEWGSCEEMFSRMENFFKHAEGHLAAACTEQDDDEPEGERTITAA